MPWRRSNGPRKGAGNRGEAPSGCSAAKAFVECLKAEGVDVIFGYPGGAVLPIYDALYDAGIKHVLVRHEQGAIHMAGGVRPGQWPSGVCWPPRDQVRRTW